MIEFFCDTCKKSIAQMETPKAIAYVVTYMVDGEQSTAERLAVLPKIQCNACGMLDDIDLPANAKFH